MYLFNVKIKTGPIVIWAFFFIVLPGPLLLGAQTVKTENLLIVTLDGMRWQEVFGGIDSVLLRDKRYTRDSAKMAIEFWNPDLNERRKKLFPFFWNTIVHQGQLYGNRIIGSVVNTANTFKFSYPGYNEIFTGYPDDSVNSNDKIRNKNINVLEFLNKQARFHGQVAIFSSWDVFPYILNKWRSGLYVNADTDSLHFNTPGFKLINQMQLLSTKPLGLRPDIFTYFAGKEYLLTYRPKILYIAFDETDDFAHAGAYDLYIGSAHAEDAMLADLWTAIQRMPQYKNKTTLIVTCDHGRGDKVKEQWKDHGTDIEDAGQIWIAALGPDTPPSGEVMTPSPIYQKQLAVTMAALLGLNFIPDHGSVGPIKTLLHR